MPRILHDCRQNHRMQVDIVHAAEEDCYQAAACEVRPNADLSLAYADEEHGGSGDCCYQGEQNIWVVVKDWDGKTEGKRTYVVGCPYPDTDSNRTDDQPEEPHLRPGN